MYCMSFVGIVSCRAQPLSVGSDCTSDMRWDRHDEHMVMEGGEKTFYGSVNNTSVGGGTFSL